MPSFSGSSRAKLYTCHPKIVRVFLEVIRHVDCTIVGGVRSLEEQRAHVAAGRSKTMRSKHLRQTDGWAHAVDAAPYPQRWNDPTYQLDVIYFGGLVMGIASQMDVKLRYGGDWDFDTLVSDEKFVDRVHFELVTT